MVTRHNIIIILFSYALSSSAAAYVHLPSFSTRTHNNIFILAKHLIAAYSDPSRFQVDSRYVAHRFRTVFRVRGKSFFTRGSWLNRPWCHARYTKIGRYIPWYCCITCRLIVATGRLDIQNHRKTIIHYINRAPRGLTATSSVVSCRVQKLPRKFPGRSCRLQW